MSLRALLCRSEAKKLIKHKLIISLSRLKFGNDDLASYAITRCREFSLSIFLRVCLLHSSVLVCAVFKKLTDLMVTISFRKYQGRQGFVFYWIFF